MYASGARHSVATIWRKDIVIASNPSPLTTPPQHAPVHRLVA